VRALGRGAALRLSDESALIRYVKGYSNKKEREKIRERSLRGKLQRALNGKVHNMGTELYGWRRDKVAGVRLILEAEAAIVRRIFALILEGRLSYHAVSQRLNAANVLAPGAGRHPDRRIYWTAGTVQRIVRNPAYKGEAVAWRWKQVVLPGHAARIVERPAEDWVALPAGVVPAIVTPDQWQAAQEVVHQQVGDRTRNEQTPYLLRGIVYCSHCGRKMWPSWNRKNGWTGKDSPKYRTYRCSSYNKPTGLCGGRVSNAEKLEEWVWERVSGALRDPDVIAADLKRRQEEGPDPILADDLAKARREVIRCEREQKKLVAKLREAEDTTGRMWTLVEEEVDALEADREQWQQTMRDIEKRLADREATTAQLEAVRDYCARVSGNLDRFGFDERRTALEALAVRVTANGTDWDIEGSIPLTDVVSHISASSPHPQGS
jgi:hypothetical protein